MKRYLTKNNIITLVLIVYVTVRLLPQFLINFKEEGQIWPSETLSTFLSAKEVKLPDPDQRTLVIFWASWCGPCKIEMARLQNSIDSQKISASQVFAVNPFENEVTIEKFIRENQYQFHFVKGSSLAQKLQVQQTPTTLLFDKNKIVKMSSGLSLIGIWYAELFLSASSTK